MRPADSALGIFRSPDPDLCVPGRRILRPREPCIGVTITYDLRWNIHISNMCIKANRTLSFLRQNLYQCPQNVIESIMSVRSITSKG